MSLYFCLEVLHLNGKFTFYKKISQTGYSEKYILTVELGKKELLTKKNKVLDLLLDKMKGGE